MTSKEEYKQLCETHELPLFLQDWWVHSVSAGLNWDVLFARDSENNICAVMPYVQDRRWWRNCARMAAYGCARVGWTVLMRQQP